MGNRAGRWKPPLLCETNYVKRTLNRRRVQYRLDEIPFISQTRESQLNKTIEKLTLDLDKCVSKREDIYRKHVTNNVRLKRKNDMKMFVMKKINDLRKDLKTIQRVYHNIVIY